jgi:hypothetical protein
MSRLKNITSAPISLQMYNTSNPTVNLSSVPVVIALKPGEDILESAWLVSNISDPSYNKDIIDGYVASGILTRVG